MQKKLSLMLQEIHELFVVTKTANAMETMSKEDKKQSTLKIFSPYRFRRLPTNLNFLKEQFLDDAVSPISPVSQCFSSL